MIQIVRLQTRPAIVFSGRDIPPTTNNLRMPGKFKGQSRLISTKQYRDWKLVVGRWLALGASRNIIPVIGEGRRYALQFFIGMWSNVLTTSADMANREKAAIDAMVEAHILPQDSMRWIVAEEFHSISAANNPFKEAFVMVRYWEQEHSFGDLVAAEIAELRRVRVDDDGQGP